MTRRLTPEREAQIRSPNFCGSPAIDELLVEIDRLREIERDMAGQAAELRDQIKEEKRGRCTCCGGYATPNKCSGCYDGEHFPACGKPDA